MKRKRVRFSEDVGDAIGRLTSREVGGGQDDIDLDDEDDEEDFGGAVVGAGEGEEDGRDAKYDDDDNEVPIEPFNLRSERKNDGYFDAQGSFVFRKGEREPDAWLASMDEAEFEAAIGAARPPKQQQEEDDDVPLEESLRSAAYILQGNETIAACLRRLGRGFPDTRRDFDLLTEISDSLVRHGRHSLEETRSSLLKQVEEETLWEYKDTEGILRGPFPTSRILEWRAAGYFTGSTAVPMRRHIENKRPTSDQQEFLDDFGDDHVGEEARSIKSSHTWRSSDDIDFRSPANQPPRKRRPNSPPSSAALPDDEDDDDDSSAEAADVV